MENKNEIRTLIIILLSGYSFSFIICEIINNLTNNK